MLLVVLTNFGKDLTHKKKKKPAIKNAYLGSIFIPEKCLGCVLKVLLQG